MITVKNRISNFGYLAKAGTQFSNSSTSIIGTEPIQTSKFITYALCYSEFISPICDPMDKTSCAPFCNRGFSQKLKV